MLCYESTRLQVFLCVLDQYLYLVYICSTRLQVLVYAVFGQGLQATYNKYQVIAINMNVVLPPQKTVLAGRKPELKVLPDMYYSDHWS